MSVAQLFNIPANRQEAGYWSFANADDHELLVNAINQKYKTDLLRFVLDPIQERDLQNFLLRHQFMHDQMDNILGIGGNDYTGLDLENPSAVQYLWQQHANEHVLAHQKLGI